MHTWQDLYTVTRWNSIWSVAQLNWCLIRPAVSLDWDVLAAVPSNHVHTHQAAKFRRQLCTTRKQSSYWREPQDPCHAPWSCSQAGSWGYAWGGGGCMAGTAQPQHSPVLALTALQPLYQQSRATPYMLQPQQGNHIGTDGKIRCNSRSRFWSGARVLDFRAYCFVHWAPLGHYALASGWFWWVATFPSLLVNLVLKLLMRNLE